MAEAADLLLCCSSAGIAGGGSRPSRGWPWQSGWKLVGPTGSAA